MWELEERQLQEKHQQLKQQLKDQYFMQRHQLLRRHEKVSRQQDALMFIRRFPFSHPGYKWVTVTYCVCEKNYLLNPET